MGVTWWRAYALAGAAACAAFATMPAGVARGAVYALIGLSSAVAIVVGVRKNRPSRRAPWYLMAAGQSMWMSGDALYSWYEDVQQVSPFPSPADAFYLAGYPLTFVALLVLIRNRRGEPDRSGLIDSAIVTVGLGLLSWVFLMQPALSVVDDPLHSRLIALSYPLADVLLLGLLARLLTTSGARTAAFRLLTLALALLLAADSTFQLLSLYSQYTAGVGDLLFVGSYVTWGAAALHPSMRALSAPPQDRSLPAFTVRRLVALTGATLMSPATLAGQLALGARLDGWAVVASSAVLFVLVVVRMAGLVTRLQDQAGQLAALAKTDHLTGLPNRRTADAELNRCCLESTSLGEPLCVAMVDLDRFKAFNDTYGHQAGDQLLVEASRAWRAVLNGGDIIARYGGEEFVLILPGKGIGESVELLRMAALVTPAGQSFSAGVAEWHPGEPTDELLKRVDEAMYASKRGGRDRITVAVAAAVGEHQIGRTAGSRA